MTDIQFITLLKRAFFDFFFIRKSGKRPSLMNILDIVELYKKHIKKEAIKEFRKTIQYKNLKNENNLKN